MSSRERGEDFVRVTVIMAMVLFLSRDLPAFRCQEGSHGL